MNKLRPIAIGLLRAPVFTWLSLWAAMIAVVVAGLAVEEMYPDAGPVSFATLPESMKFMIYPMAFVLQGGAVVGHIPCFVCAVKIVRKRFPFQQSGGI